jgi:serine/threonine-protein kinase
VVGRTISHYRILAKLGEGGMGAVYQAEDLNLGRTVALKFLAPHTVEDEESKARLLREAKVAALLDHPNICTVFEIAEQDGQSFLAMPFIEGRTVRDRIAERPLRLDEALDIAIQAAHGLQAAHEKGIVHRDVKSANLMITPQGQVKVMDFGLAQLSGTSKLTKAGTTLGTVGYMAPEAAEGKPTDRRSDIWSLGVVLYEMVTGRLPFEGERDSAVLFSIVSSSYEPVTALRAGVPIEIDRVVAKALAKNPAERYQHADDLAVDLAALRKGSQKGLAAAGRKPLRRELLWAAAGGAGLAAAAVGLNVGGSRDRLARLLSGGPSIRALAVLPLSNLSGDPEQDYFAEGMTDALITDISQIGALKVICRNSVMQYKGGKTPLRQIARDLNVDAVVEGSVVREGGRVRVTAQLIDASTNQNIWAESYERELTSILSLQKEVARSVAKGVGAKLGKDAEARFTKVSRQANPATYEAYLRGMHHLNRGTPEEIAKGMKYLQEAVDKDPADALAYSGLAIGYITIAHGADPTQDALERAGAAARRAFKLDDTLPDALIAMGFMEGYYEWRWEDALQHMRRALEINPSSSEAHFHMAWFLPLFGKLDEAIEEHKLAKLYDPFNPGCVGWLGELYRWQRRYSEAAAEALRALEVEPRFAASYYVLAKVYQDQGDLGKAIATIQKGAEIDPYWRWAAGEIYAKAGRTAEARKVLAECYKAPTIPWVVFWRAFINIFLGDMDEAFRWLDHPQHHAWHPWVRAWPECSALWKDPRFPALMKKMNLPPVEGSGASRTSTSRG